jgi:hypothetical protein
MLQYRIYVNLLHKFSILQVHGSGNYLLRSLLDFEGSEGTFSEQDTGYVMGVVGIRIVVSVPRSVQPSEDCYKLV